MSTVIRNKRSELGLAVLFLSTVITFTASVARAEDQAAAEPGSYRILITNDDGIDSPGLAALVEALAPLGEITIVAPLENQSGIGHALNLRDPIFPMRREVAGRPATALTATPATCVRVAIGNIMKDAPPDLVVSGVNRGLNFGRNAYISGTVAAAREAALQGIPAIAASLDRARDQNYIAAAQATAEVAAIVKEHGLPPTVFLNVNVPLSATEGLKLTHQSLLAGSETFEARQNPYGRPYFWSFFAQPTAEAEPGSDIEAVRNGYVAVTPLQAHESAEAALLVAGGVAAFGSGAHEATSSNAESRPPILLGGGQGEAIAFPVHPTLRLADPDSNIAGMSFFEIRIPAGSPGAPPHTHKYEDEFFYVREGTITFMANEERRKLKAGGFVLLPRHSLHAMWNTSDEDAILLVGTSAGEFGDFFDAVAMEVRGSNARTPSEIGAILGRLGAERGVIIDMTKVPKDVVGLYGR